MRNTILATFVLLAGVLSAAASINVEAWYHLGEPGTIASGTLPVDSTGHGNSFNDSFSEFETVHVSANTPGGPLGTSGYSSTSSSEWGRNGDVIISALDGYAVTGDNFGIEVWVLPFGNGYNVFCCEPAHDYTARIFGSGGDSTGLLVGLKNNQDGTFSFVAGVVAETGTLPIGDPVPMVTNDWTHLAVVRDNGVNTFYVNGVASGATTTDAPSTNLPTSGDQNGMVLGAAGGAQVAFRGLLDEARAFTFQAGAFSVTNLLYPSASATKPLIVAQPASTSVWDGGAAVFSLEAATSPNLTYQWQRGGQKIVGATAATLFLPTVSRTDDGSVFACLVTNTVSRGFTVSSNVLLSIVPVRTNNVLNYDGLITNQAGLVAYFPADHNTGVTLSNLKNPAQTGTLEGKATYDGRTDRAFGQRAIALDRGQNLGDVTIPNNPDYYFPGGEGTVEAVVYMADLGVFVNGGPWSFPTIFSVGESDRSVFQYLLGVSKTGAGLVYSDGSTTANWATTHNLVGRLAHVAFVFYQATGVTAYLDGRALGTGGEFTPVTASTPAWIGSAGSSASGPVAPVWNGTIDEVAIYTSALSAATINAHYSMLTYGTNSRPIILASPSPVTILAGAANRTAVFTVDAEGTYPLSYQWNSNGIPIPGATSTSLSLPNTAPSFSATYSVTIANSAGSTNVGAALVVTTPAGYAAAVTADKPLAYWRLGERGGLTMLDSWGTNNGTYIQPATLGLPGALLGNPDTSVAFDGLTAEARVPNSPELNPNGPFTIEAWVKPLEAPPSINPAGVLASLNFNAGRSGWIIYQTDTGFNLRLGDSSGYTFNQIGVTTIQANTWYYVAAVYDGANATLYVNGKSDTTGAVAAFAPNDSASLEIGAAVGVGRFVKAQIDEVAFYNTALSANRITAHFSAAQAPLIGVSLSGADIILTWSTGVLYQADDLTGAFTVVTGASSPLTVQPTATRKFYLLRAQ